MRIETNKKQTTPSNHKSNRRKPLQHSFEALQN